MAVARRSVEIPEELPTDARASASGVRSSGRRVRLIDPSSSSKSRGKNGRRTGAAGRAGKGLRAPRPSLALEGEGRDQIERILLEVAESMTMADGMPAALDGLVTLALRATGADRSAILALDAERLTLLPAAAASRDGDSQELWKRFRAMEPIEILSEPERLALWETPRTVALADIATSQLVPENWKKAWGSKSVALSVLRASGEIYGVLAVDYFREHHVFTSAETRRLDAIASAAGVALRSARMLDQLRRSLEVERRLTECIAALRSGRSLTEIAALVADGFASLIPDSWCSIIFLGAGGRLRPVTSRGPEAVAQAWQSRLSTLDLADINRRRQANPESPILVGQFETFGAPDGNGSTDGSAMIVPLVESNSILGLVVVGRERTFMPDEVRVAEAFADHVAVAIVQGRLADTLQARLNLIETLQRLSDTVTRTSDLKAMLRTLNHGLGAASGIECVRVAIEDSARGLLATSTPTSEENRLLREWRRPPQGSVAEERHESDGNLAVPVRMQDKIKGLLWVRLTNDDPGVLELVRAIATGIGEVASKAKLRLLSERRALEVAVAADRERIARDLHDTVGQTLFGIGLGLAEAFAQEADPEQARRLEQLRTYASRGIADVRSAVYELSAMQLRARGFVPSLRALLGQFEVSTGVGTELVVRGKLSRLAEAVANALYRVAHEALVNVELHARATGVVVTLSLNREQAVLTVRDDGVGIDQRQVADWRSQAHFGLRSMARAMEDVGGTFRASPAHPRGLLIEARVPFRDRRPAL